MKQKPIYLAQGGIGPSAQLILVRKTGENEYLILGGRGLKAKPTYVWGPLDSEKLYLNPELEKYKDRLEEPDAAL